MIPQSESSDRNTGRAAKSRYPPKGSERYWPMSMFCGFPMSVSAETDIRGTRKRKEKRKRVEPLADAPRPQNGCHSETDHIVREERRHESGSPDDRPHDKRRRRRESPYAPGNLGVETSQTELRRNNHKAEQEQNCGDVDPGAAALERRLSRGKKHDCAQKDNTGAVKREARKAPKDHPQIDGSKNKKDKEPIHHRKHLAEISKQQEGIILPDSVLWKA